MRTSLVRPAFLTVPCQRTDGYFPDCARGVHRCPCQGCEADRHVLLGSLEAADAAWLEAFWPADGWSVPAVGFQHLPCQYRATRAARYN